MTEMLLKQVLTIKPQLVLFPARPYIHNPLEYLQRKILQSTAHQAVFFCRKEVIFFWKYLIQVKDYFSKKLEHTRI